MDLNTATVEVFQADVSIPGQEFIQIPTSAYVGTADYLDIKVDKFFSKYVALNDPVNLR